MLKILYFLKKFFLKPSNYKFSMPKKCLLKSQAKLKPSFLLYPFFNHFLNQKSIMGINI